MTFAASRSCGLQALAFYRKQTTFIEKGTIRMSDANSSRRTFMALAAAAPAALAMGSRASAQAATVGPAALPGAGRAAVVTGSSRGIGAATARRLASDGFAVTLNYLTNRNLAARVVADIEAAGGRAIVRQADVADPAAVSPTVLSRSPTDFESSWPRFLALLPHRAAEELHVCQSLDAQNGVGTMASPTRTPAVAIHRQ